MNNLFYITSRICVYEREISILLMMVVVVMSFTACGKFTYVFCGEKRGKNYKSEVLSEEAVYVRFVTTRFRNFLVETNYFEFN